MSRSSWRCTAAIDEEAIAFYPSPLAIPTREKLAPCERAWNRSDVPVCNNRHPFTVDFWGVSRSDLRTVGSLLSTPSLSILCGLMGVPTRVSPPFSQIFSLTLPVLDIEAICEVRRGRWERRATSDNLRIRNLLFSASNLARAHPNVFSLRVMSVDKEARVRS